MIDINDVGAAILFAAAIILDIIWFLSLPIVNVISFPYGPNVEWALFGLSILLWAIGAGWLFGNSHAP